MDVRKHRKTDHLQCPLSASIPPATGPSRLPKMAVPPITAGRNGISATGVTSGITIIAIQYSPVPPTACPICDATRERNVLAEPQVTENMVKRANDTMTVLRRPKTVLRRDRTKQKVA